MSDPFVAPHMKDLFDHAHPDALYHLPNRRGVSVIALRTSTLSQDHLASILAFRLTQYLSAGLVDPNMVAEERMEQDPSSSVSPRDIHIVAGSPATGRILCYSTLRAVDGSSPTTTMLAPDRPLFPVEKAFGWGIYNHLHALSDMPITRILELGRFARNYDADVDRESGARSSVEVCVAIQRILCYSATQDYDAVVGDVEETGAKRNLDFFHTPCVILRDIALSTPDDGFLGWVARTRTFLPFIFLVADLARQRERLTNIENALDLPGERGMKALVALKRNIVLPESSLS